MRTVLGHGIRTVESHCFRQCRYLGLESLRGVGSTLKPSERESLGIGYRVVMILDMGESPAGGSDECWGQMWVGQHH